MPGGELACSHPVCLQVCSKDGLRTWQRRELPQGPDSGLTWAQAALERALPGQGTAHKHLTWRSGGAWTVFSKEPKQFPCRQTASPGGQGQERRL